MIICNKILEGLYAEFLQIFYSFLSKITYCQVLYSTSKTVVGEKELMERDSGWTAVSFGMRR